MEDGFNTTFGYIAFWVMKYIFIPIGIGVVIRLLHERYFDHSLKNKEKNGLKKPFIKTTFS